MKITQGPLSGIYILEPETQLDSRGSFTRVFCEKELNNASIPFKILQVNQSVNIHKGTLRGLHSQTKPKAEKKIVQCLQGEIFDVVVNINPESKHYGKYFSINLSQENQKALYISEEFAHGFQTLQDNSVVQYFMNEFYAPEYATGVAWNDPFFKIKWPILDPIMSIKDSQWDFIKV